MENLELLRNFDGKALLIALALWAAAFNAWRAWRFKRMWSEAETAYTAIAKENVVGTFGILFGGFEEVAENGWQVWQNMRAAFTPLAAYSFLMFNLLCAPCFSAVGAIRREMNSLWWTSFAVLYQTVLAYAVSLIFYQLGMLFMGAPSPIGTAAALALLFAMLYMILRRADNKDPRAKAAAGTL